MANVMFGQNGGSREPRFVMVDDLGNPIATFRTKEHAEKALAKSQAEQAKHGVPAGHLDYSFVKIEVR